MPGTHKLLARPEQVPRRQEERRHSSVRQPFLRAHLSSRAVDRRRPTALCGVLASRHGDRRGASLQAAHGSWRVGLGFFCACIVPVALLRSRCSPPTRLRVYCKVYCKVPASSIIMYVLLCIAVYILLVVFRVFRVSYIVHRTSCIVYWYCTSCIISCIVYCVSHIVHRISCIVHRVFCLNRYPRKNCMFRNGTHAMTVQQ